MARPAPGGGCVAALARPAETGRVGAAGSFAAGAAAFPSSPVANGNPLAWAGSSGLGGVLPLAWSDASPLPLGQGRHAVRVIGWGIRAFIGVGDLRAEAPGYQTEHRSRGAGVLPIRSRSRGTGVGRVGPASIASAEAVATRPSDGRGSRDS